VLVELAGSDEELDVLAASLANKEVMS
jgi:hypothetical protein